MTTSLDSTVTIPAAGSYFIDPARSSVTFEVKHLFGLARARGSFTLRAGSIDIAEPVEQSTAQASIDAVSFTTNKTQRDDHVRSAKFLDAAKFPDIDYVSQGLKHEGGRWVLNGQLTVCGVTQQTDLEVTSVSNASGVLKVTASTRVNRYLFGVTKSKGMAGRDIDLVLEIVASAL
jgi:polyisoprenoid-binding protein YceI